jgi:hypothetical protein
MSPGTEQAVAGLQAVTTAGVPPGQTEPTGQMGAVLDVDPAGHPYPATAVQAVQEVEAEAEE